MSLDAAYPSRQELIALNKRLTKATAARDAAQESYDRLERPTRLLTDVSREHAAEKALHDAAIVVWYESGCPGVRPDVPSRMIELERPTWRLAPGSWRQRDSVRDRCERTTGGKRASGGTAGPATRRAIRRRRRGCQGSSTAVCHPGDDRGDVAAFGHRGSHSRTPQTTASRSAQRQPKNRRDDQGGPGFDRCQV